MTTPADPNVVFAHECRIRDAFAAKLTELRPGELVSKRDVRYLTSTVRADLRTVDRGNVIREWEFKVEADYSSIGQALTYLAQAKLDLGFDRTVLGVIAAFTIPREIRLAVSVNNLGIELVEIPTHLCEAGFVPSGSAAGRVIPAIPRTSK